MFVPIVLLTLMAAGCNDALKVVKLALKANDLAEAKRTLASVRQQCSGSSSFLGDGGNYKQDVGRLTLC
jgi:hypothetical protein